MKYTKNSLLDLAVVIPAYNEEQTIKAVVDDCIKALKKIKNSAIFVYDNNSKDKTAQIVNSIKNDKVIYKKCSQQGKGFVIRKAFREVDARCLVMLDGDMTYPAADIPKLYKMLLENDLDMVIGDRLSSSYFTENKRPFHNFGNSLIRKSINTLFRAEIKDILTGFRAFSYKFVKSCPILSSGFSVETEMSIYAIENRMALDNYVIDYKDRPSGSESKLNTYSDGFKALNTIFRLYRTYHPLAFYGSFAFVITIVSAIIAFFRCLLPYLATGQVLNIPTLIVCSFAFIAAVVSFFSGMILDSLVLNDKRQFELILNEWENYEKTNSSN